jgi:peptide/nickel transport system permease protein
MGQLTNNAVQQHDLPIVQGAVIVMAGLVVAINLLVDVVLLFLNPKTRTS